MNNDLNSVAAHFGLHGTVADIKPLGNGLINDTYKITTAEPDAPDYVLQRINNAVFQDVDLLQHNIEVVTDHIRKKLQESGTDDIDRKVLTFVKADNGKTYWHDGQQHYWRVSVFIPRAKTYETVNPYYSEFAGQAFGQFEAMLTDLPETLGETIPDFHNMELRYRQLIDAVSSDRAGRLENVHKFVDEIERQSRSMCLAEQLHREGKLPKRVCHCDTKVNNMMFDEDGHVLCVIDLDTVMPSYVFSDFGDFLRTAANTVAEDEPDISKIAFRMDIFEAFTAGYLRSAGSFLTPVEKEHLPYAAMLFPYMQCVRFLTDYINGDTYYKTAYPTHNLVRARNQWQLFLSARSHADDMRRIIERGCK